MKANFFFAGSFFCAVVALCVGQIEILKNEALLICAIFALVGSILLKFGLDAVHSLDKNLKNQSDQLIQVVAEKIVSIEHQLLQNNTDNRNQSDKLAQTVAEKLADIEHQLLENNNDNKNNINLLCEKYDEKIRNQIEALTKQIDVLESFKQTVNSIESDLKPENNAVLKKLELFSEQLQDVMRNDSEILKNWKNEMHEINDEIINQLKLHQDFSRDELKVHINNIEIYSRNIFEKLNTLIEGIRDCENVIKKQRTDFSTFVQDDIGALEDVLREMKNSFVKQNEINREQLTSVHERYADVTEKDIQIINKIYDGLKNEK